MSWQALAWAKTITVGGPGPKAVLLCLADRADEAHSCYPSQALLAKETEQGERTVRRQLAVMEEQGFIRRERRMTGTGRTSDRYVLAVSETIKVDGRPDLQPAKMAGSDQSQPATDDTANRPPVAGESPVEPTSKETSGKPDSIMDIDPEHRRLCDLLADLIEANGSKRPTITKAWLDAVRLMITRDGREADKIERCIRWCQDDEFWRANVLSMPTLRKQYDKLRLAAQRSQGTRGGRLERIAAKRAAGVSEAWL